jgi:ribose transport system ATP-binding protein
VAQFGGVGIEAVHSPQAMKVSTSCLDVRDVSKTFALNRVLCDVDLDVRPGEIHALVGHNGSGKSTLVKILAGYHSADRYSTASVGGKPFELGSAESARKAGLRFVHQNLGGLVDEMSVSDNFCLQRRASGLARLRRTSEHAATARALENLGSEIEPTAEVGSLTESERTLLAVARAIEGLDGTGLVVLDEPTASLNGNEVRHLFNCLQRLVANGTSILFISHDIHEVLEFSQRVTILRDGRRVATETSQELSHDRLVALMLGHQISKSKASFATLPNGIARMEAHHICGQRIVDLHLSVSSGEIVGVAGLTGSGREELGDLLSGRMPRQGRLQIDGRLVPGGNVRAAIDAGVCYSPADRQHAAILHDASVRENLTIGDLSPFWKRGIFRHGMERDETSEWITRLDVRNVSVDAPISELSGGNQQKIVIARWLRLKLKVLLLDEPTQGVDVGARVSIHRLVEEAAAAGAAVVVCSTDADELASIARRVVIMAKGRSLGTLEGSDVTSDRIDEAMLAGVALNGLSLAEGPN